MANTYFQFKQFTVQQDRCAMKVTTDGCLFGSLSPTLSEGEGVLRVLDIGTGTGLLVLMFAQKNQNAFIDAIEIDKDAAEQAKENITASPWADRIKVIHADARSYSFPQQYDVIISNPPFYENELKADDKKKNVAHHSDDLSLAELLTVIKNNLSPSGIFFLLLPYKRNEEIKNLILENDLALSNMVFVKQSVLHGYFRIMLQGKLKADGAAATIIDEIAIKNDKGEYTEKFMSLLSGFYLHL